MCQTLSEAWTSRRFNNRREPRSLPSLPPSYAIPRSYQWLCKPVTQRSEHKHPMAGSWSLPGYSPQMERGDLERARSRCRQQRNSRDRHRCPFWLLKWERQFIGGEIRGGGNCGSTQRKLPKELLHCFWNSLWVIFTFPPHSFPALPLVSCVFMWDTKESLFTRVYCATKPVIRARINVQNTGTEKLIGTVYFLYFLIYNITCNRTGKLAIATQTYMFMKLYPS